MIIENLILTSLLALFAPSNSSHADSTPVLCGARCVMVEQGRTAAVKLRHAPRPGLNLVYVDELGVVTGADLDKMKDECNSRATGHPKTSPDARGIVVDFLSIYPFGDIKAVVDYQIKTTCTSNF